MEIRTKRKNILAFFINFSINLAHFAQLKLFKIINLINQSKIKFKFERSFSTKKNIFICVKMLKKRSLDLDQSLIICLIICFATTRCVEAQQSYSLRKFSLAFKEASIIEERRRRKEEEQRKLEQVEDLRRRVIEEYLLRKTIGKTTVLRDFYSRF